MGCKLPVASGVGCMVSRRRVVAADVGCMVSRRMVVVGNGCETTEIKCALSQNKTMT